MKPAPFKYYRPQSLDEALSLLKEAGEDGKILAGGQSLMPLMNFRLAQPGHLIDINFIDGLDYIKREHGFIKIGCLVRQSRLEDDPIVRQCCPLLAEASACVGYAQIRNRGTLCGSLVHADPAAEYPAVLVALDGRVTAASLSSKREIEAKDFFHSYMTTALAPDEIVVEASIPEIPGKAGWSFREFSRRIGDFALAGVAVLLVPEGNKISDARIALTGVGEKPWRERAIEKSLVGMEASEALFRKAGAEVAARISPGSDMHASEWYRRSLSEVLTRRALAEAWGRAKDRN